MPRVSAPPPPPVPPIPRRPPGAEGPDRHRFVRQRLLGTVVEVVVGGLGASDAEAVAALVLAEMTRLESVFSIFDPTSTLCRWRTGELDGADPELGRLLALALEWQQRSGGVFNPLVGELTALWRRAQADGHDPDPRTVAAVASAIAAPRVVIDEGGVRRIGDCGGLDLNAIAKGHIVDRAVEAACRAGAPPDLIVSAGGDLLHRGDRPRTIGIENPLRPYDNEPPLTTIEVANAAVAGSGSGRRGVAVAGRRLGHVIDPRTGRPAEAVAGAVVVAVDATTADVVATVVNALSPTEAISWLETLPEVAGLVVAADGTVIVDTVWLDRFGPAPPVARVRRA